MTTEEGVIMASTAIAGVWGITWFTLRQALQDVRDNRDKIRAVWAALFGEPGAPPNGLKRTIGEMKDSVDELHGAFRDHVKDEAFWQQQIGMRLDAHNSSVHLQMSVLERRLDEHLEAGR